MVLIRGWMAFSEFASHARSARMRLGRLMDKMPEPRDASTGPELPPMGVLNFPLVGDISHAGHFVTANWPSAGTAPVLNMQTHPMTLVVPFTAQAVRDLQDVLTRATLIDGPLAKSARAFRMLLATKLSGRVIPNVRPSSDSRTG
jgi:hypothetical protein